MIQRQRYLNWLEGFKDKDIVKVIVGIRRSGKSILLQQFAQHLKSSGILPENIISINFESFKYDGIKTYTDLYTYIESLCIDDKRYYIFLDEVQKVEEWEKAVAAMRVDLNADIYITGSNAWLLSSEISTLLSGRTVEMHMMPLSFAEYKFFFKELNSHDAFEQYMMYGGFPGLLELSDDMDKAREYLEGIINTVVVKDILGRTKHTNTDLLFRLLRYMTENIGNLISAKKVADYLSSNGYSGNYGTVSAYLDAFEKAYVLYRTRRYGIKGKKVLKAPDKYYVSDMGIRSHILGYQLPDRGRILENIIGLELIRRGYGIHVGSDEHFETDFIATKHGITEYYQVALSAVDEAVMERELNGLRKIRNQHPKYLLTMDYGNSMTEDGIKLINIVDWLLDV